MITLSISLTTWLIFLSILLGYIYKDTYNKELIVIVVAVCLVQSFLLNVILLSAHDGNAYMLRDKNCTYVLTGRYVHSVTCNNNPEKEE